MWRRRSTRPRRRSSSTPTNSTPAKVALSFPSLLLSLSCRLGLSADPVLRFLLGRVDLIRAYLNGPRQLSASLLSKLVFSLSPSQPSSSATAAPDQGEKKEEAWDVLFATTHYVGDGMALHAFMNEFYTLIFGGGEDGGLEGVLEREKDERLTVRFLSLFSSHVLLFGLSLMLTRFLPLTGLAWLGVKQTGKKTFPVATETLLGEVVWGDRGSKKERKKEDGERAFDPRKAWKRAAASVALRKSWDDGVVRSSAPFPFCRVLLVGLTKRFLLERRCLNDEQGGQTLARRPPSESGNKDKVTTCVSTYSYSPADTKAILAECKKHGVGVAQVVVAGLNAAFGLERGTGLEEPSYVSFSLPSYFFRLERVWLTGRHMYSTVRVCQGCFIRPCQFGTFSRQTSSRSSPTFI